MQHFLCTTELAQWVVENALSKKSIVCKRQDKDRIIVEILAYSLETGRDMNQELKKIKFKIVNPLPPNIRN